MASCKTLGLGARDAGESDIPGLTDEFKPRQRGPKRATKIMKLFNIEKGSGAPIPTYTKKYARVTESNGKKHVHRPKVQRLVTPLTLQRKRRRINLRKHQIEKVKAEKEAYAQLLTTRKTEERERRSESQAKKRAARQASQASQS